MAHQGQAPYVAAGWNDFDTNPYAWGVAAIASVLGVGNIVLGIVLASMPGRLQGASFTFILQLMPSWVWGAGFIASGATALLGQYMHLKWSVRVAHTASAFGATYWVLAFAWAGYLTPDTSITGCIAYGVMAATHAVVAIVSPHGPHR